MYLNNVQDNSTTAFGIAPFFNKKEAKKDEYKIKKEEVANLLRKFFQNLVKFIFLEILHTFEDMVVKTDFETRGFNSNNLPGRIFQAEEMINLLKQSGINSCPKEQITRVIDKMGIYLANNGRKFFNFFFYYLFST